MIPIEIQSQYQYQYQYQNQKINGNKPPPPPSQLQLLPQLSISNSNSLSSTHYNALPSIKVVSDQQPNYLSLQRESTSAAYTSTTNRQQKPISIQFVSYSPGDTLPKIPGTNSYLPASSHLTSSVPSYLTQPTTNNTQDNIAYQFPVTISMNYNHQLPPQQEPYSLSSSSSPPQQQEQSPRQSMMKPTKVSKTTRRKSKDTQAMVSKFSSKMKTKKSKRNHTLIPNNNIYYPIHRPSVSDSLAYYETQFLNNFVYPKIEIKKYSTSALDPQRSYITAYEFPINNHWVIWDYETGWVHLTGIWKASLNVEEANVSPSHMKADIVKLLESTPKEYQHYIKRIRGGFLKIQGTWLPYKLCKILARRFCYYIRFALIPIFGVDFPQSCLNPTERGFGELKLDDLHSFEETALPLPIPVPPAPPALVLAVQPTQQQLPIVNTNISFNSENKSEQALSYTTSKSLPPVGALLPGQQSLQTSPLMHYTSNSFPFNSKNASSDGIYNTPRTPPNRHYSSSSSISSISSSVFSGERITPISNEYLTSEIPSFNEMIDIVNASKCLQTLSKDSSSPRNLKAESKMFGSQLVPENGGITAILLAAGLSGVSNNHREEVARSSPRDANVKAGMTINDLLT